MVNRSAVPYVPSRISVVEAFAAPTPMVKEMRAMGQVGTLFAIVTKCAGGTAQVEWKLWRKARSGKVEDRVEVTNHLALQIWNKPNDFYTRQEFVESTQQHFELTGESWWVISRSPGSTLPMELWPVRPDKMQPVPDAQDFIVGYIYTGPSGEQIPLSRDQVIMVRAPNPMDPYRGMGPVQTILPDLNASAMAAQYVAQFFENSAEPGGLIEVPHEMSDHEFDQMTTRWREQHQGVGNAHRVGVLENGAKWVDRKYTMKDMQFTELRSTSSEMIREAFGFPKPMLGSVDDVNRANAEAAEYVFAKWLLVPRLERIKQALNSEYLRLFFPKGAIPDVEFDYDTPVPEDKEFEATNRKSIADTVAVYMGLGFDPTAVLEMFNLPDLAVQATTQDPNRTIEAIQKIYLGVGIVVTAQEARKMLNQLGAGLASQLPEDLAPKPPAPPIDPDADPVFPPPGTAKNLRTARTHWPTAAKGLPDEDHPDLTGVQESWQAELDALIESWSGISDTQQAALVSQVADVVSSGTTTDLLRLSVASEDGAAALQAALIRIGAESADHVVDEAADQDVEVAPVPPRRDGLIGIAVVTAGLLAEGLTYSAIREALRVWGPGKNADQVADLVAKQLAGLTDAQPRALLGAALTQAQRQGRMNTLLAAPTAAWYASEQLDKNTCGPCRKVNGKWLGNSIIENVNRLYPTGGYIDCEGRDRCRGMVIGIWRPKRVGDQ